MFSISFIKQPCDNNTKTIFLTRLKSIFSLHNNEKMLPSNNTGINFQFCRLQNYGKKHAEKVDLKKI